MDKCAIKEPKDISKISPLFTFNTPVQLTYCCIDVSGEITIKFIPDYLGICCDV